MSSTPSNKKGGMGRGLGALGLGGPVAAPPAPASTAAAPSSAPAQPAPSSPAPETNAPRPLPSNTSTNGNGATPSPVLTSAPVPPLDHKTGLKLVPITSIAPNPYQPRKHIDPDILAELAQSIRENGLIQPPVVSYNPDYDPHYKPTDEEETGPVKKERKARYLLIAGERRWQASKLAGFTEIPVVLKEATPIQMLEMALVENIQRADLNPLEEAQAYQQLMLEFKLTQEKVAQRVGKSRAAVANSLRLFDLPDSVLKSVYQNVISEGHARALLMVRNPNRQHQLLQDIITKQYSVRQTEEMARRLNAIDATADFAPADQKVKLMPAERENRDLEDKFREALGVRVNLSRSQKGGQERGKLTIEWDTPEQLDKIYNNIVGIDVEI